MFQRRRGAGDGHWRTRVSMQEVIERDRRVPECHTWHWVVRGDLGLAGPYLSLPESPARTCPPSHSSVQREDSAVWKLCTCGSASEKKKKSTRARRAVQVLILWRACVGYAHTCFLRGGRNSWFQKEVSHYQQEHRLVCLPVKNKAVCSLLELHSGLASRRKRVLSVLTQHMRFADICSTTDASSAALKPIVSLCCWAGLNGGTVGAERPALTYPMRKQQTLKIFLQVTAKWKSFPLQEDYYLLHPNYSPGDTK